MVCGALLFTFSLYFPGLTDIVLLDDNSALGFLLVGRALPADWLSYVFSDTGPLGRSISMLSFFASFWLSGADFSQWKLENLILHLATAGALFKVAQLLVMHGACGISKRTHWIAVGVVSLWVSAPVHVSTVLYTVQRMTILASLFSAIGVALYFYSRLQCESSTKAKAGILLSIFIFTSLAAFSKEIGLLLPAYLVVAELTVLAGIGDAKIRRYGRRALLLTFTLAGVAAFLHFAPNPFQTLAAAHLERGFTIEQRLLTESRIVVQYLSQIVTPSKRNLGFFHDDVELSVGIWNPPETALSIVLICGLIGLALIFRRAAPLLSFGVLWFFVGHSMESTLIPLELMFEHRNYLPSFGLIFGICGAVVQGTQSASERLPRLLALAAITLSMVITRSIVLDWRTPESMYSSFYGAHPLSERAASQFAEILTVSGKINEAESVIGRLDTVGSQLHLWHLRCRTNRKLPDDAFSPAWLSREATFSSYAVVGLIELSRLSISGKCGIDERKLRNFLSRALQKPIVVRHNRQKLIVYAAHFAWRAGDRVSAYEFLNNALESYDNDAMPALLMSEWKLESGDILGSEESLSRAEAIARKSGRDISKYSSKLRWLIAKNRERLAK